MEDHLENEKSQLLPPSKDYEGGVNPLALVLSLLCPFSWIGACFCVNENEHAVILHFGKFSALEKNPGCYCSIPCGRDVRKVSTRTQDIFLHSIKVVDSNANPLIVSGVVNFYFEETIKSALDVEDPIKFITSQATTVLKRITSRYPYESDEGTSLQHETEQISRELINLLQGKKDFIKFLLRELKNIF